MKARLPRQELLESLQAITLLTAGRTTRPILNCVKLSLENDTLELSATDGETALRTTVPCLSVDRRGETVVNADRFLQIVREFPDVEIALRVDDRHCVLSGEGSEFKIYVQSPEDFPPVPAFADSADLAIDGRELTRMIALTLYAAARETSRYAINGVLWQKAGRNLFMVATDGRRLARAGGRWETSSAEDFEIIVPAKALSVFERVFAPAKGSDDRKVDVKVLPNQLLLRFGSRVLAAALVDGHFPNYQEVIPREHNRRIEIERGEFHAAIRRAALLTTEDSRAVRLSFSDDRLTISSQAPEQGEARIEVKVENTGPKLEIGFNPTYLSDALKVLPYDRVVLELSESFKPGVLCGPEKDDFLYVIMPVTLQ
jgi:DNA polymerase-3 subunit beta